MLFSCVNISLVFLMHEITWYFFPVYINVYKFLKQAPLFDQVEYHVIKHALQFFWLIGLISIVVIMYIIYVSCMENMHPIFDTYSESGLFATILIIKLMTRGCFKAICNCRLVCLWTHHEVGIISSGLDGDWLYNNFNDDFFPH